MISIMPLWTYHLCTHKNNVHVKSPFKQPLHIIYTPSNWYYNPELSVHVRISSTEGCCWERNYWTKLVQWFIVVNFKTSRSSLWLGLGWWCLTPHSTLFQLWRPWLVNRCGIQMYISFTQMTRYMLFVVVTIAFIFHGKSNTTGATSGTENTYPSGTLEFAQVFLVWFVLFILSDICLHVFSPLSIWVIWKDILFVFTPILVWVSCSVLCYLYFIYAYWRPTWFPYQMVCWSFNCSTTGATCGTGTVYHSEAPGSSYSIVSLLCSIFWAMVCPFSFGHCIVCPSSIYNSWLSFWYL